jgi:L-malate glycosyltransferase
VNREVPCRLLMVGDGPDRGPAESLARELGLQDRVLFLGKQLRVNELLPVADLLLLPSEMESFGLAALEAMACGVPPVASKVGGVPEVVTDGADGFLLPVGDTDGMAQAAVSLLTNPAKHEALAAAARRTAEERFATTRIIPQYEDCYRELCGRE